MVFVTWSSLTSFSDNEIPLFEIPHFDKLVHFTFYFVAVLLGVMALREKNNSAINLKRALTIIVLSMILFGMLIEVVQYSFTLDRSGDKYDVLANSIGAIGGFLAIKLLFSSRLGLKWKQ